jgi:hypothetical protein
MMGNKQYRRSKKQRKKWETKQWSIANSSTRCIYNPRSFLANLETATVRMFLT